MTFSKENIQAASNSIKEAAGENYGKIINHLQKDSVCFISAFNDGLSYNENIERHNELETNH